MTVSLDKEDLGGSINILPQNKGVNYSVSGPSEGKRYSVSEIIGFDPSTCTLSLIHYHIGYYQDVTNIDTLSLIRKYIYDMI